MTKLGSRLGAAGAADAFLGDHRHAGQQPGEAFQDDGFGCLVGGGDRREVVLDAPLDRSKTSVASVAAAARATISVSASRAVRPVAG